MTSLDVARLRLHAQQIARPRFTQPGEAVAWLGAMQAQDYLNALWAVGLRTEGATEQTVEQAIRDKELVRTWPMRGTLHFVASQDVRWMLALLTPRILSRSARRHRQLELDAATLARSEALLSKALEGGGQLTRGELMDELEREGISTSGQRGYHILCWAAQKGLICFGPRRGKADTFVLLDEWLPEGRTVSREEALAELAQRYFTSHGPATLQDFVWWSGLLVADARAALAMAEAQLAHEVLDEQSHWFAPLSTHGDVASSAHLLSAFDQYLLGYRDRSAVLDPAHATKIVPGANGVFRPIIVVDGRVVGTWKRTVKKGSVVIERDFFHPPTKAEAAAFADAAERFGAFLGLPIELLSDG